MLTPGPEHALGQSPAVAYPLPGDGTAPPSAPRSSPRGAAVLAEGVLGAGRPALREYNRRERWLDEVYDEIDEDEL